MTGYVRQWILAILFATVGGGPALAQMSPGELARPHSKLNGAAHCTDCHDSTRRPPEFKCAECHREIQVRLEEKRGLHPRLMPDKSGNSCVACHPEHNGKDYSLVRWETPLAAFDHRKTGYTLEGRHARLNCRNCHQETHVPAEARAMMPDKDFTRSFLGLSPKCTGCHADEHHGQLSAECSSCHDSADWKHAGQFNHDRARFILAGAHEKAACQKCHPRIEDAKPYVQYRGIPHEDCVSCHKDPHRGAFRSACRSCHETTASWKPSDIPSVFNHFQTKFPLLGKHAGVLCASCHRKGDFKEPVAHDRCADCHKKDPHRGQFTARTDGGDCSICHKITGFKPSTFEAAQHAATRFPLKARHAGVTCVKCHAAGVDGVQYRFGDFTCATCHRDTHGGQFQGEPYRNRCEQCHTDARFKPSTFSLARHDSTRFLLTGAHKAIACTDCHRQGDVQGSARPVAFRQGESPCTACHEDPHLGQFEPRMKTTRTDGSPASCGTCHTTRAWRELQGFDHSATEFRLEGTHRTVGCGQCHKADAPADGMRNVMFKTAPRQCSSCHDDVHGGQFISTPGTGECSGCHSVWKWTATTFDHDTRSNYRLDGTHRNVRCVSCHVNTRESAGKTVVIYKGTPRQCAGCHGSAGG